jgi:hypothetical protein
LQDSHAGPDDGRPDVEFYTRSRIFARRKSIVDGDLPSGLARFIPVEARRPSRLLGSRAREQESGQITSRVGVIGWGSSFGSVLEAVKIGWEKGYEVGALKISSLFPYHEYEIRGFMERCDPRPGRSPVGIRRTAAGRR